MGILNRTYYLDGFQYLNTQLQFFPTTEGYVSYAQIPELQEVNKFSYVYNYTDHLGNIRLSYTENPKNLGNIVILEENNYYPFGLQHAGYNKDVKEVDFVDYLELTNEEIQNISEDELLSVVPVIKNKYKYKYQGQERQDELNLNWDSFKWRNYDYAIGRFMSVDPLADEYTYNSPYAFSENKVVMYNELEGLETGPANWMQYSPAAKQAGITPTTWNKIFSSDGTPFVTSIFKSFFPKNGTARSLIDQYSSGTQTQYTLSQKEMIEVYPLYDGNGNDISLALSNREMMSVGDLDYGESIQFSDTKDVYAGVSGTLGNFTVTRKGTIYINPKTGLREFKGTFEFNDTYDFNASDHRPWGAEVQVTAARNFLTGKPFEVFGELEVKQTQGYEVQTLYNGQWILPRYISKPEDTFERTETGKDESF